MCMYAVGFEFGIGLGVLCRIYLGTTKGNLLGLLVYLHLWDSSPEMNHDRSQFTSTVTRGR